MRDLVRDYSQFEVIACPLCQSTKFSPELVRADSGTIVRCSTCRHVYVNPTPSDKVLDEIYAKVYSTQDLEADFQQYRSWFELHKGYHQVVLRLLGTTYQIQGKKLLEVGCAMGFFSNACKVAGAEVQAVEANPKLAGVARSKFNLNVEAVTVEKALQSGVLKENSFDFVVALELIEHLRDPRGFLEALFKLIKPGGIIIVTTPNFEGYKYLGRAFDSVYLYAEHIHFFEPPGLKTLFEKIGFRDVQISGLEETSPVLQEKIKLGRSRFIRALWGGLRKLPLMVALKNWYFGRVNKTAEIAGQKSVALDLVGIGKKPAG